MRPHNQGLTLVTASTLAAQPRAYTPRAAAGDFAEERPEPKSALPPRRPGLPPRMRRSMRATLKRAQNTRNWVGRHATMATVVAVITLVIVLAAIAEWELNTSGIEAHYVTTIDPGLTYRVDAGPSDQIRFPKAGPYDVELGYARLPDFTESLEKAGYGIETQARLSPLHAQLVDAGLFPAYQEKSTHGLKILGDDDTSLYDQEYPKIGYGRLADVPDLVVTSLLFIEDRQVLGDDREPTLNPAVSWDRLTKATMELFLDKLISSRNVPGGSTLATQLEKFRHSEDGRTHSSADKLRQMASATTRAYLLGTDTRAARERIVLDYINGVPLGAASGIGQITGLGEGLKAWYGTDLADVNAALSWPVQPADQPARARRAKAFKEVLSLFLSQRRPAYYLQRDQAALAQLTDKHVRLMEKAGAISPELAADALAVKLELLPASARRTVTVDGAQPSFVDLKAANAVRVELQRVLQVKSLYELDRLDAEVSSTFDQRLQEEVTRYLTDLQTEDGAKAAGLIGERLLSPGQAAAVNYSFTLTQRLDDRNVVRVQADTMDSPLDLNRGGKLELGSTAKLRTLCTYLQMIAEAYEDNAPHLGDKAWFTKALDEASDEDDMGRWVLGYLREQGADATLAGTLEAAMQRPFSASPYQGFATGGGILRFQNFEPEDNGLVLSVAEGFQRSSNLVFVRVMREVVQHVIFTRIPNAQALLADPDHPARRAYLARFIDMESRQFLGRFYGELKGLTADERMEHFATAHHLTTSRLAALILTLRPDLDYLGFHILMDQTFPELQEKVLERYWKTLRPGVMSLNDRAYVARVHPLELWLSAYLEGHPAATLAEAQTASTDARFDSYQWLVEKAGPRREEKVIRTMLEREAFEKHIIGYWRRQGFPFDHVTPSYASALGSSGDRPSALADLVGALYNDGVMMPTKRIEAIKIGGGTPFETTFGPAYLGAQRAVSPEVAAVAREALLSVVDGGTARRLKGTLKRSDGTDIEIGGKTGTGDNRLESFGPGGRLIKSEKKSRTATFVFAIGDRFYGTFTAFVKAGEDDEDVGQFRFTSALVVQALKSLMPTLRPVVMTQEDPWATAID